MNLSWAKKNKLNPSLHTNHFSPIQLAKHQGHNFTKQILYLSITMISWSNL